jgi:hypothetical protein
MRVSLAFAYVPEFPAISYVRGGQPHAVRCGPALFAAAEFRVQRQSAGGTVRAASARDNQRDDEARRWALRRDSSFEQASPDHRADAVLYPEFAHLTLRSGFHAQGNDQRSHLSA